MDSALNLDLEPAQFVHCRSYAQMLNVLFSAWAAREGKPRWGDKTPQYVASIPVLLTLYPNAKVIHCYRDGRDVALSCAVPGLAPATLSAPRSVGSTSYRPDGRLALRWVRISIWRCATKPC